MPYIEPDFIICSNPTCDNDEFEEVKIVKINKEYNKIRGAVENIAVPDRLLEKNTIVYRCTKCGCILS